VCVYFKRGGGRKKRENSGKKLAKEEPLNPTMGKSTPSNRKILSQEVTIRKTRLTHEGKRKLQSKCYGRENCGSKGGKRGG